MDLNLRILISAVGASGVTSTISSLANTLGSTGLGATLNNAFGNIAFGMRNLKTEGSIGMDALKQGAVGLGGALWQIAGITALVGGAAAIALGTVAVKAAADFQGAMDQNVAHAGLAASQVQNVNSALLAMGPTVGQGPTALAQALYPILSGFSGISDQTAKTQVSLAELKDAAMSVAGSTTSVSTAASAATSAFNAYGLATNNVATNTSRMHWLFDVMNNTITQGNMKWDAYAGKIGSLAAVAAQSGVKFTEANAALAVFTNAGQDVDLAGTHLMSLFQSMSLDVDTYVKRAGKLHESFDKTKFESLDLAGKLQYLEQITGGDQGKLKAILGNKTLAATFQELVAHSKDYQGTLSALNHSQGATATAFQVASQGFGLAWQRMQAAGQSFLITIGSQLLPVLTRVVNAITPVIGNFAAWLVQSGALKNALNFVVGGITNLVTWIGSAITFFQKNQWAMDLLIAGLITLAGIITGLMIAAFVAWAAAMLPVVAEGLMLAAPFILAGLIITAVIFGIIMAVQHWGAIAHWLQGVWGAIAGFFVGLFTTIWNFLKRWGLTILEILIGPVGWIILFWKPISTFFAWLWGLIVQQWDKGVKAIQTIFSAGIAVIQSVFQFFKDLFTGNWGNLGKDIQNIWQNALKFIQNIWGNLPSGLQKTAQAIWDNITAPFKQAFKEIQAMFSGLGGWLHDELANMPIVGPALHLAHIPGFAEGVQNFAGGYAIVGENGPELIQLPAGSSVYPQVSSGGYSPLSSQVPGSSSTGGSSPIIFNITINGMISRNKQELMAFLIQELTRELHSSGKLGTITSGGRL